jgi:16S rRNA (adenine1518-N6/adenine1519-N6)-dimethyltransferase
VERAKHVIAVELDPLLAASLRAEFPPDRLTVVQQDVLAFAFDTVSAQAGEHLLVFGNLPYYITSPILLKLAANSGCIERAALMVQREVADRVTGRPRSRDYGSLSVTLQMYGALQTLFTLPPASFSPPPDVHSSVFRWIIAPRFAELGVEEQGFLAFVRSVFAQKRKTLANNLRAAGLAPQAIDTAIATAAINPRARAEELSVESLANLYLALGKTSAKA